MIIEKIMTRNPVTAEPSLSVEAARKLMRQEKVHRLPVLGKDKRLLGIVSEKDILRAAPASDAAQDASPLTVESLMTRNPWTVTPDTIVEDAARQMAERDLSCLPVMKDGVLVGIVSKSDLFKMILDLFGARRYGVRVSFLVDDRPGTIAAISRALSEHGIDIISFGTCMGTGPTNAECTIKLQGAPVPKIVEIIEPFASQILDVREV